MNDTRLLSAVGANPVAAHYALGVEPLLIAPLVVLVLGAALAAVLLRRIVVAVEELDESRRRSRRVEDALIPGRVETRRARASIDRHSH